MMQGVTDVLTENELPVIIDIAARRQRRRGFASKISAIAGGQTQVPGLAWPKADARIEGRLIETHRGDVPRFGARREGRIFHFGGVIKLAKSSRDGNTACVTRSPNHRIKFILRIRLKPADEILRRSGRGLIADGGDVFINQRCVDEWIVP